MERVVNITPESSAEGLRETLENEAIARGKTFRPFVGQIYAYAVKNKSEYTSKLRSALPKKGKHIGAVVSDGVNKALKQWAKDQKTSRGRLCCYILEKTLEDELLGQIFSQEVNQLPQELDDPDDPDDD